MEYKANGLQNAARWAAMGSAVAAMVSVAVSQSLLGAAAALLLLSRKRWTLPPGALWFACFTGWTLLSLLLNGDPAGGLPQVRKLYVWLLLFVLVSTLRGAGDFKLILQGWLALGTVASLRGLWQFWMKWQAAASSGTDFYQAYVGSRITGFMSHWMTFSSQMMVALLCGGALLLFSAKTRKSRWLLAAALAPVSAALLLGFTRGIWIAAAAGAVYLAWNWKKWSVLALPLAAALLLATGPASVQERLASLVRPHGETDSNQHRVVTWRTGMEMIRAHPLLGLGPEQVGKRFESYLPADISKPLPEGWYGHLHNIYLQYAAERGLPALWFLLLCFFAQTRRWRRSLQSGFMPAWAFHAAMALLIGFLVTGFFEHNLGDSEVLQFYLATVAFGFAAARSVSPAQLEAAAS